jgi:hypothetical protein
MKKLLLSVFALASSLTINAQCTELFISEYVEGSGNNKALEIYNPTNAAINLTGYRIERFSNGSASSSGGGVLNLSGTIGAHDVFVIANGQTTGGASSPACDPALQAMADQLDVPYPAPTYMNGNDAIVLFKNTVIIDIFGKTGDASMTTSSGWSDAFPYDGSAGWIWTENHTLYRKATVTQGVTANPGTFIVTTQWDSLPVNTWTGLGSHACACGSVGVAEVDNAVSVVVYPNPADNNYFNISAGEMIENIEVVNIMGQQVLAQKGSNTGKNIVVETASLSKGVYFVKVLFENNKTAVVKISIQ